MTRWHGRWGRRVGAALTVLVSGACTGGSETGNPGAPAELTLAAHSSKRVEVDLVPSTPGIFLDEVWVSFGEIEFQRAATCGLEEDDELRLPAMAVDLSRLAENVSEIDLPEESYCRVGVPLEEADLPLPAGAPAALEGNVLVVSGRTRGGIPFELVSRRAIELEVSSELDPFPITDATREMVLSFDLARWFEDVDLDAGVVDPDGLLRIDDGSNSTLLQLVEERIGDALELVVDRNGNGLLDETDSPLGDP